MKRHFQKFRDDLVALTTLQNPDVEVRTYAESEIWQTNENKREKIF